MPGHWDDRKIGPKSVNRLYSAPVDLVDPAAGAKVPRCRVCGMPNLPDNRLIYGVWTVGTFRMRLVLCEREIPPLDPRDGDSLRVEESPLSKSA